MTEDKVLHTDPDGLKVVLHTEHDGVGNEIRWISYERYPDIRYGYLTALQAAEKILSGEEIPQCYIEALTVDALKAAEKELKTGQFEPMGPIKANGGEPTRPVLKPRVRCNGCLIGKIDLSDLILQSGIGLWPIDEVPVVIFGETSFNSARFGADANFSGSIFGAGATFEMAAFFGESDFYGATFIGDARFAAGEFSRSFNVQYAVFRGLANLWAAKFGGRARFCFASAVCLDMRHARFERVCDMEAVAAGKIDFGGTVFAERLMLSGLDGTRLKARQLLLEPSPNQRIADRLDLWRKSKRPIYSVNFRDTLVQGELVCDFEHLRPTAGTTVIKPHREKEWDEARKQYAWLKEQFRKRGAYKDEDEAHWWASECSRKGRKASWPLRFGEWLLYRKVLGYGVKPLNVIGTIIGVIGLCSLLFSWAYSTGNIMKPVSGRPPFDWSFLNGLYFSVITFATVGYGDVRAVGWAAGLAMIEGLLGIALNAALVVVIFRKLIR